MQNWQVEGAGYLCHHKFRNSSGARIIKIPYDGIDLCSEVENYAYLIKTQQN